MFDRQQEQSQLKPIEELRNELADLRETIELQQEAIKNGGGIVGLEESINMLENYQRQQATLEEQIQHHPDARRSVVKLK